MPLKSLLQKCKAFAKEEEGASGIEYALIAAMVAVLIAAFVPTIGPKITAIFNTILTALS